MQRYMFLLVFFSLFLVGCGGGGGGSSNNNNGNSNNNGNNPTAPKPPAGKDTALAVESASKTAPWKDQPTVTPNGSQVGNAKTNLDSITNVLLVGIASSGKKHKTDVTTETTPGPVRGSMTYKNTYTYDDAPVGDSFSYSDVTEIKFNGYVDVNFSVNGTAVFSVTYQQTSQSNSTYKIEGSYSISYKDATGVFAFHMSYKDESTIVNGVETLESTCEVDGESYTCSTVTQINGDYVSITTYVWEGVTYTSSISYEGGVTAYEVSHMENGQKVIDSSSSSTYDEATGSYAYTYIEDGIEYTYTSITTDNFTTIVISHIENGEVVVDSASSSGYEVTTIDGVEVETYIEVYTVDDVIYTTRVIIAGDTTTYITSHYENGEEVIDSNSTSTTSIIDGVEVEVYEYVYVEDGVEYTYRSTVSDTKSVYTVSHMVDGKEVYDSYSETTETIENGKAVERTNYIYYVGDMRYESTSTTIDDKTTVVVKWTENGKEQTYTYDY